MAVSQKLLIINKNEPLGNGLKTIRARESDMIDISEYEPGYSDATCTTNPQYVIKDNKVYKVIKTYFDLDKSARIFLAKEDMEAYDHVE